MIGTPMTDGIPNVCISGVAHEGLAVINAETGAVIAAGPEVTKEAWNVTLKCYRNFRATCACTVGRLRASALVRRRGGREREGLPG